MQNTKTIIKISNFKKYFFFVVVYEKILFKNEQIPSKLSSVEIYDLDKSQTVNKTVLKKTKGKNQ